MQISMKCSLAVHCLIFMHEAKGRARVTSTLLSQSTGSNPVTIRTVMGALKKAGIISVERGGAGGAELVEDPADVTLYDIYHAVEPDGLDELIRVHDCAGRACPVARNIGDVLARPYAKIEDAVRTAMQQITLQELIDDFHARLATDPLATDLVARESAAADTVAGSPLATQEP